MKRLALAVSLTLMTWGLAHGGGGPAVKLTLDAAQKQAYWYSLYNVAHLTMFSGMGKIMKGGGMTGIIEWLKGGGVQKAVLVKDMYMISSVYAEGDPHFTRPLDPDNKRSMGWAREKMDKTLNPIAVLWAFSDLALISSDPEVPHYNDVDLARWSGKMADKAFKAAKTLPPESIIDKAVAIEALGRYVAATRDKVLRREALGLISRYAKALRKGSKKTITEMGLSVYGLMEAFRVTGNPDFMKETLRIFNQDMESLWDEKAGVYANSKGSKRHVYAPFDVGAVLAALNSMIWFSVPSYDDPLNSGPDLAKKRYIKFFENAVAKSGMQHASGISLVEKRYVDREPRIHFAHPSLPRPEEAGGEFGIAPVYAFEVTFENGKWVITNEKFDTKGAMFLANMSVIMNRHQVDAFIPLQRLMARLLADAGI